MPGCRSLYRFIVALLLFGCVGVRSGASQAVVRNHLNDKWQLSGAVSYVRFTTTIRVDSDQGPGTEVDAEDELNADRAVPDPRLGIRWGISRKHSLEFGYQWARRNGERTLERTIEYQGETYDAGLLVKSRFDSDVASLTWRWAFHASEKSRIGATLGLGGILFHTALDGYLSVNDQSAEVSTERNFTAPVAGLGAFGQWRLGPKWYLEADVRGLYIPVARFEVFEADLSAVARWFPWSWGGFELGLGGNVVRLDINKDPEKILTGDFSGKIRYSLANMRAGVILAF